MGEREKNHTWMMITSICVREGDQERSTLPPPSVAIAMNECPPKTSSTVPTFHFPQMEEEICKKMIRHATFSPPRHYVQHHLQKNVKTK